MATGADDSTRLVGRRRWPTAVGIIAVALALVGVVAIIGDDDRQDGPGAEAAPATELPTSTDRGGFPGTITTIEEADAGPRPAEDPLPPSTTIEPETESLVPPLPAAPVGIAPTWIGWRYPVPPVLDSFETPTVVVALTDDGILHRVEFPSGSVRSIETGLSAGGAAVYSSDDVIAVQQFDSLAVFPPGEPVVDVDIGGGIGAVWSRGDTGEFIVRPSGWDRRRAPVWSIDRAGEATMTSDGALAQYAEEGFTQFLPAGDLLVFEAGGTYAVAEGGARRLSPGIVAASGRNHIVARECDDALRCGYVRIDHVTGERQPLGADLDDLPAFFTGGSVSPDGRTVLYADYGGQQPVPRLVDLESGVTVDAGPPMLVPRFDTWSVDPWSSDGSGVFVRTGSSLAFVTRDGATIELEGLGDIAAVAVAHER